jgi:hypothetical protein
LPGDHYPFTGISLDPNTHIYTVKMSTIRKESKMKLRLFKERGQALILIALAGIALFGITGLAIDGSAKFSDRRHAQNAADTAALAGALTLARGGTASACSTASGYTNSSACLDVIFAAWERADQNGYDGTLKSDVEVYSPPVSGTFADCNDVHFDCKDYVQVIVTSYVDTWFMRVLGIGQTTNVVQAVASKFSSTDMYNIGGNAVVALAPDGCALMSQGNTGLTVIGGGMYSNSDDTTCSFKKESCAGVTNIDADTNGTQGTITMVGGASINTGCPPDAGLAPAGTKQIPFPPPYAELAPPPECSEPLINNVTGTTVTLEPGHYANMPPKPNIKEMILKPGVYCIDGEIRIGSQDKIYLQPSIITDGTFPNTAGVFFYIMPGAAPKNAFTFNAGATVQLWGINDASVGADSSLLPYKSFLIYSAPNYTNGGPDTCKINGGSLNMFKGTIYAPYCDLTINGGSGTTGFQSQLVAYNVKFSGGSEIILNYQANSSPTWEIPLHVGLNR